MRLAALCLALSAALVAVSLLAEPYCPSGLTMVFHWRGQVSCEALP